MTSTTENPKRHRDVLERILAMLESIDRNVEEILDDLHDHLADMRFAGWTDEPCTDHDLYE